MISPAGCNDETSLLIYTLFLSWHVHNWLIGSIRFGRKQPQFLCSNVALLPCCETAHVCCMELWETSPKPSRAAPTQLLIGILQLLGRFPVTYHSYHSRKTYTYYVAICCYVAWKNLRNAFHSSIPGMNWYWLFFWLSSLPGDSTKNSNFGVGAIICWYLWLSSSCIYWSKFEFSAPWWYMDAHGLQALYILCILMSEELTTAIARSCSASGVRGLKS